MSEFKEHIFGCTRNMEIFWIGLCVPCGYQYIQAKAATDAYEGDISFICFLSLTLCLGCYGAFITRRNILKKLRIQEEGCTSFTYHVFCSPCASCQEYREVKRRNR